MTAQGGSQEAGRSYLNEAACPMPWCRADVDVPPGTFDGATIHCRACDSESVLAVSLEGDWWLYDPDDDE